MNDKIQLYEDQPIRTAWVEDEEEWYFSIVDVVQVLTESADGRKYWNKLKQRLKEEGSQLVTNCHQLKLKSPKDGNLERESLRWTNKYCSSVAINFWVIFPTYTLWYMNAKDGTCFNSVGEIPHL